MGGKTTRLSKEEIRKIAALKNKGVPHSEIASRIGRAPSTVGRYLRRYKEKKSGRLPRTSTHTGRLVASVDDGYLVRAVDLATGMSPGQIIREFVDSLPPRERELIRLLMIAIKSEARKNGMSSR